MTALAMENPGRKAYFAFAVIWVVSGAWQYGFHISALNSAQDAISCRAYSDPSDTFLPSCIPMTDALFGLLTSLYTVGGLFGSLGASRLADASGRRKATVYAALANGLGSVLMTLAPHYVVMTIGRLIIGVGCGLATVLVPMYLHEISPPNIRGSVGVLNQLGIVFGILTGQALSLPFAKPNLWRAIFVVSAAAAAAQVLLAPTMVESPLWAKEKASAEHPGSPTRVDGRSARVTAAGDDPETAGLLGEDMEEEPASGGQMHKSHLSVLEVLREWRTDPAVAKGMRIVLITQLAQQISGINAVMYYSTSILKSVLETRAAYISLFITIVNVIMTFPPIWLIERLGRRSLLLTSSSFMAASSFILAFSINFHLAVLSSAAIVAFVAAFSIGLGPVPFVVLGEVMPPHAKSAASSFGLGINWATNGIVGLLFLPIRNALAVGDGRGNGNVFFLFTAFSVTTTVLMARFFR